MTTKTTMIANGGVSGYINKELELKTSPNGVDYVQVLLGRGKKQNSQEFLTAYALMAYGNVAKLLAATIKKGDLVRFTKVNIQIVKDESVEKYDIASTFKLVVEEFEKIEMSSSSQTTRQERAPQESNQRQQAPQPQPQAQPAVDSFDDDIPF